jgi:hypothetical protein
MKKLKTHFVICTQTLGNQNSVYGNFRLFFFSGKNGIVAKLYGCNFLNFLIYNLCENDREMLSNDLKAAIEFIEENPSCTEEDYEKKFGLGFRESFMNIHRQTKEFMETKKKYNPKNKVRTWKNGIYVFKAGKGDCFLVAFEGKHVLIDGGMYRPFVDNIFPHLIGTHIDYMICTHADQDHYYGLYPMSLDQKNLETNVVLPSFSKNETSSGWGEIKKLWKKKNFSIKHVNSKKCFEFKLSDSLKESHLKINVLCADESEDCQKSKNLTSLCTNVSIDNFSAQFTADSNFEPDTFYSLLQIPHHGSHDQWTKFSTKISKVHIENSEYLLLTGDGSAFGAKTRLPRK